MCIFLSSKGSDFWSNDPAVKGIFGDNMSSLSKAKVISILYVIKWDSMLYVIKWEDSVREEE